MNSQALIFFWSASYIFDNILNIKIEMIYKILIIVNDDEFKETDISIIDVSYYYLYQNTAFKAHDYRIDMIGNNKYHWEDIEYLKIFDT